MTLDSLPSYTYCTACKKRPDPLPLLDRPLVDPETGETPPLSPRRGEHLCLVIDDFGVCVECNVLQFEGPDDAA